MSADSAVPSRKHIQLQYAQQLLAQGLSCRQAAKQLGIGASILQTA